MDGSMNYEQTNELSIDCKQYAGSAAGIIPVMAAWGTVLPKMLIDLQNLMKGAVNVRLLKTSSCALSWWPIYKREANIWNKND